MKDITTGTVPHYAKHRNNVKVVHTKETIMSRSSHPKTINGKMPQKYEANPQRNTHADVQIL